MALWGRRLRILCANPEELNKNQFEPAIEGFRFRSRLTPRWL